MKTITYDETKYKLMPIEPTSEMLVRGGEEFFDSARNWKIGSTLRDQDHAGMIYEGMLAVAPTPPAVEQPHPGVVTSTSDGAFQARYRIPGGEWSNWGAVICGVKWHEQELRYLSTGEQPSAQDLEDAPTARSAN